MKKILSIILVCLMLSFCIVLPAFAADEKLESKYVTFSDDLQKLYFYGQQYSRADTSSISYSLDSGYVDDYVYDYDNTVYASLTPEQKKYIDTVDVFSQDDYLYFDVTIYYSDSSQLIVSYLRDDLFEEYDDYENGNIESYYVEFTWPDGNTVKLDKNDLLNGPATTAEYYDFDMFSVYGNVPDGKLFFICGEVYYKNGEFYYYDYNTNNDVAKYYNGDLDLYDSDPEITLVKITNTEAILALEEGLQKYYDDDMGYMFNDELQENVSKVFLTIIFGIIPFASFVAFIVLAIKSRKKIYKNIFISGGILCIVEIATFIITACYIFK